MEIKSSTLRKLALWFLCTFVGGAVFIGAIFEPLLTKTLQDHGVFDRPESWIWAMMLNLVQILEARWFEVITAMLAGFAAGVWLDGLSRRQEMSAQTTKGAGSNQISSLEAALGSAELVLQFHGGPNTPTELKADNILHWYALWSADFHSVFEGPDGQKLNAFNLPRTWAIFVILDKPIKYKQMIVKFGSPNAPGFQVNLQTGMSIIVTSTADIPAGVLEIRSLN